MSRSFCSIPLPKTAFVGPSTIAEFDRIDLPETVHDWKPDGTHTIAQGDGQQWERRVRSKCLGDFTAAQVTVVFQWFEYRPVADALNGGGAG